VGRGSDTGCTGSPWFWLWNAVLSEALTVLIAVVQLLRHKYIHSIPSQMQQMQGVGCSAR
jgi:ABC-type phosphate transport system auxiliary subunit